MLEIVGGTVGAGVGIGITFAMVMHKFGDISNDSWHRSNGTFYADIVAGSLIALTLVDAGIYVGGQATSGRGTFGATLLGSLVGVAVGSLPALLIPSRNSSEPFLSLAVALIPVLTITGGVVGYELSDAHARGRQSRELVPVVAPVRGGATLGLTGNF